MATASPTPTCAPPAAPSAQTANNITFSSFTARWGSVIGATGYRLDVSTSNTFTTYVLGYQDLDVGNVISFPVTGLNANTTYYYRVRAYNGCGTSPNSSVKTVKTLTCTPKTPSAQNASDVTSSSFTAHWGSVSDAIDYRLDVSTSSTFATYVPGYQDLSVGNVTSYSVTGLNANTIYYYRVRAFNGCATSLNSSVKNVQTLR
jgi:phosphodiesterase/alkaline phosphatase D-like protein